MNKVLEGFSLEGKTALVTGGGGGIGSAACLAYAEAGADLVIPDADGVRAEELAHEIVSRFGRRAWPLRCDVTKEADIAALDTLLRREPKRLDVSFNNAGIAFAVAAVDLKVEDWDRCMAVNLRGVFLTAQLSGRLMLERGSGSIIATASMSGHIANLPQTHCAYNASKAGVVMLMKSLAVEWGPRGVRCNSISPGYINTRLSNKSSPWYDAWLDNSVMRRLGETSELVGVLLYLASDYSSFTNGADIAVDGGYTCR